MQHIHLHCCWFIFVHIVYPLSFILQQQETLGGKLVYQSPRDRPAHQTLQFKSWYYLLFIPNSNIRLRCIPNKERVSYSSTYRTRNKGHPVGWHLIPGWSPKKISMFPISNNLRFSPITKRDRALAYFWHSLFFPSFLFRMNNSVVTPMTSQYSFVIVIL